MEEKNGKTNEKKIKKNKIILKPQKGAKKYKSSFVYLNNLHIRPSFFRLSPLLSRFE